ncbi:MAG: GTPase RsgA, partial [Anaerolineae bacterium]|nr:GTPase RsgA [Anaerolineae bacterium]
MASRKAQNKQEQREQYRLLQKVRKESKHHRKEERVRQKGWLPGSPEEWDALAAPQSERVMPRGERDRRRANLVTAATMLAQEANGGNGLEPATAQAGRRGTVVEVSTALYRVSLNGSVVMCGLRGGLSATEPRYTNVVAVGDEVIVSEDGAGSRLVERVLPRRSVLARPDFARHLQQVIVANVDQLLIVASWREPAFWFELVDRYLIAAARSNLSPIICVNKVDLAEDRAACRDALRPYLGLGYRVLFTSAVTGEGLDELK